MEQKPIAVDINNKKVVFAIPAKPKPPKPWYVDNFGWLLGYDGDSVDELE